MLFERSVKHVLILLMICLCSIKGFSQPGNDDPCNAIVLTVGATCTYTTFTNAAATATAGVPAPGCANYLGGDVWFQVTVPAGGALIFDTQTGVILDGGMAIYSGAACVGPLTLIECDDDDSPNGAMSYINRTGLTPGSTVWIRVWEYGNNNNGTFGICVTIPPPPPANDDPCNAIALTVAATCTYTTYTTASATATTGVPAPGCANYLGGDVWFQVTVPAGGALRIDTQTGVVLNGGMAIYSGTACSGPLTLLLCNDDSSPNGAMPQINTSGLTPGSTVWIRVWEFGNDGNGTFGICVTIPPPPPANDDPCNAIALTVAATCTYTTYTTASATATTGVPAPGCANYQGGDVWFQVTVPCGGSLRFDTQTGTITDGGMAIYSSTCSALTLISCNDDSSPNGAMPLISANNLVPGSTVWIRIWEYGNDNNGSFGLCVTIPPPPGPGANCSTAQPFCTNNVYTYNNTTGQPSLGGGGIYGCLLTTPNPFWYYMQVQNGGNIIIGISQTSTAGVGIDVDFALWGPFNSLAATCSGLTAANNISCSYSTAATETAVITNALPGQYYILLITNFADQPGTITFQQTGGTGSSACDIICSLTAANTGPVCPGVTFNLTSTPVTGATYSWTGPNCFTSTSQNPIGVFSPSVPGSYVYTVTATAPTTSGGTSTCFDTTIVTVIPKPALGIDKALTICAGSTANLTTQFTTTGFTTAWTLASTPVTTPASVNVSGIYQLIATNTTGCTDTALVNLVVDTVTSVVTPTNANCTDNGIITITNSVGIAPFTYSISTNPGVFQTSNTFNPPVGGPYTISTKDAQGCTSTQTVSVGLTNNITLSTIPDKTICRGQSVVLNTVSNATSYVWNPATGLDDPNSASPLATPVTPTLYTVTATLGQCTRTATVNVNVVQQVFVNAGTDVFIVTGEKAQLNGIATNATSYLWTPAAGLSSTTILNPIAQPAITTLYTLTVINNNGCFASDDVLVTVVPYCIKVKNAFSPNGDGINDVWVIYDQYDCLKNISLGVFNRYGGRVFESQDYRNKWDGRYKGKPVPDGTYYAVINFTLISGKTLIIKTDLTIIR